jgi:hypothetical protein
MGNLAALLCINQNRLYKAIDAVGTRIADIQKWLKENPPKVKPRHWRRQ